MKIYRPALFQKNSPETSVILPIFQPEKSPYFHKLLEAFSVQTYQNFEVVVVQDVSPNGKARNEGVHASKGKWLIFMDESILPGHDKVFANLLSVFSEPGKLIPGASVRVPDSSSWIQKQYEKGRQFESPIVKELTESDQVQHSCMAIPKSVYEQVKGESDWLITGTDNDLRLRLIMEGYKLVLTPMTWVYYFPPGNFRAILKKSWKKGLGSAYAFTHFPVLFGPPQFLGKRANSTVTAVFCKMASAIAKIFHPRFFLKPVALICEWFIAAGFVAGCVKWRGNKVDGRPDLRSWSQQ